MIGAIGLMWNIGINIISPYYDVAWQIFHSRPIPHIVLVVNGTDFEGHFPITHVTGTEGTSAEWRPFGYHLGEIDMKIWAGFAHGQSVGRQTFHFVEKEEILSMLYTVRKKLGILLQDVDVLVKRKGDLEKMCTHVGIRLEEMDRFKPSTRNVVSGHYIAPPEADVYEVALGGETVRIIKGDSTYGSDVRSEMRSYAAPDVDQGGNVHASTVAGGAPSEELVSSVSQGSAAGKQPGKPSFSDVLLAKLGYKGPVGRIPVVPSVYRPASATVTAVSASQSTECTLSPIPELSQATVSEVLADEGADEMLVTVEEAIPSVMDMSGSSLDTSFASDTGNGQSKAKRRKSRLPVRSASYVPDADSCSASAGALPFPGKEIISQAAIMPVASMDSVVAEITRPPMQVTAKSDSVSVVTRADVHSAGGTPEMKRALGETSEDIVYVPHGDVEETDITEIAIADPDTDIMDVTPDNVHGEDPSMQLLPPAPELCAAGDRGGAQVPRQQVQTEMSQDASGEKYLREVVSDLAHAVTVSATLGNMQAIAVSSGTGRGRGRGKPRGPRKPSVPVVGAVRSAATVQQQAMVRDSGKAVSHGGAQPKVLAAATVSTPSTSAQGSVPTASSVSAAPVSVGQANVGGGASGLQVSGAQSSKRQKVQKVHTCFCDLCGKGFTRKDNLSVHMRDMHDPNRPMVKCPYCDHECKYERSIVQHCSYHHKCKDLFVCKICWKTYAYDNSYRRHMATYHPGEK